MFVFGKVADAKPRAATADGQVFDGECGAATKLEALDQPTEGGR